METTEGKLLPHFFHVGQTTVFLDCCYLFLTYFNSFSEPKWPDKKHLRNFLRFKPFILTLFFSSRGNTCLGGKSSTNIMQEQFYCRNTKLFHYFVRRISEFQLHKIQEGSQCRSQPFLIDIYKCGGYWVDDTRNLSTIFFQAHQRTTLHQSNAWKQHLTFYRIKNNSFSGKNPTFIFLFGPE